MTMQPCAFGMVHTDIIIKVDKRSFINACITFFIIDASHPRESLLAYRENKKIFISLFNNGVTNQRPAISHN